MRELVPKPYLVWHLTEIRRIAPGFGCEMLLGIHPLMQDPKDRDAVRLFDVKKNVADVGEAERSFYQVVAFCPEVGTRREIFHERFEPVEIFFRLHPAPMLERVIGNDSRSCSACSVNP